MRALNSVPSSPFVPAAIVAALVVGFVSSTDPILAQAVKQAAPAPEVAPRLATPGGAPPVGLSGVERSSGVEPGLAGPATGPGVYTPPPYYYAYSPWWRLPPSMKYKRHYYPHPGHNEPRLGLFAYDPYSWELGLQLPRDADPLPWYSASSVYEGMVGKALRGRVETERSKGNDRAIELMRAGKYRDAGRVLSEGFRVDSSPRYPLLLAEVFFALGSYAHAQLLLEEALRSPGVTESLPWNVAGHFPSQDDFDKMLKRLLESEAPNLLRAYFLLHSRTADAGLEVLRQIVTDAEDSSSEAAGILYRHYLAQVFKRDETEEK